MAVIHVPMSEATQVVQDLLAAASELGLDPTTTVKTSSDGVFGFSLIVPDEVDARANDIRHQRATPKDTEPEEPAPKKKGGRPRKAAAEPVVEEE